MNFAILIMVKEYIATTEGKAGNMAKAIIFDLFETLITEWGHEKYTKKKMCNDLGCDVEAFSPLWESLHEKQYRGDLGFEESLRYIADKLHVSCDDVCIQKIAQRRKSTKAACFDYLHPDIVPMLKELRKRGYKLAILSNCSEEEVSVIQKSRLPSLVDELILSYEIGLCKPQPEIYKLTADRLGVGCKECLFIGDGGSRELYGARDAGMHPYRAMWYIRKMPGPIKEQLEFEKLETPMDVLNIADSIYGC